MTEAQPAAEMIGVSKSYAKRDVVKSIDLRVEQGTFFSILGPSGCGKTTSLRMLAGFIRPDEGEIRLGGASVNSVPPHRRNVNTVFQSYALFSHLTVEKNVGFGLRRKKVPTSELRQRVSRMLQVVSLEDRAHARPAELSGGQQQRVALARALVNMPDLLLLDEPLGALDLALRRQMQVELKEIQRQVGVAFVYVTHDQEEALTMSDQIAVMNGGVILQTGSPEQIYERPTSLFVASFIGTTNQLAGIYRQGRIVLESGTAVPVESSHRRGLTEGGALVACIRPEQIKVRSAERSDAVVVGPHLTGTIVESVYLGSGVAYRIETESGATIRAHASRGGSQRDVLPVGDRAHLDFDAEDVLLFHRDDGRAVGTDLQAAQSEPFGSNEAADDEETLKCR